MCLCTVYMISIYTIYNDIRMHYILISVKTRCMYFVILNIVNQETDLRPVPVILVVKKTKRGAIKKKIKIIIKRLKYKF